jgi:hypothetical protein
MHRLVGLFLVTLGRLACAQERQECFVQLQLHELRDRQSTVTKTEATLGRIADILYAVTCKVRDVCRLHHRGCTRDGGRANLLMDVLNVAQLGHGSDIRDLFIHSMYRQKSGVLSPFLRYECNRKMIAA